MWIVRLALRRPYSVASFCIVILIMGLLSAFRMRVDMFPTIDIPVVVAVWGYGGLSAEEMERRVTFVSERSYSTAVNGIAHLESQSMAGVSIIKIYFQPNADIGAAIAQINASSLSASRVMPPGITPPFLLRFNASNVPVAQLTLGGAHLSEQQLFDYGLNVLRLRLFTIPGLATPAPYGGKFRQVMVEIDPVRLASRGMSPQDVVQSLLQSNVILPAGSAKIDGLEYNVALNNSPESIEEFNQIPLRVVGAATVFLGDVANVYDGYAVQQNVVRINGKRSTYLSILKKEDASTLAVVDSVRELLPTLQANAPEGIELRLDFDQSVFVRAAVKGVIYEALLAALLVSLMTLLFLGSWRSTVIVCTSIPMSIFVGLVGLYVTGQTLNLMTLGGLSLAIGMLVDDATVEVENIERNRHLGKPLVRAILHGAHQIAVPALAATLTICIVFFPVVLLSGPAKFLFTPLALAVVLSMLASYVLSRTLVPVLAHLLLVSDRSPATGVDGGDTSPARATRWQRFNAGRERQFDRLQGQYTRLLAAILGAPKFVLGCAGGCILVAFGLLAVVGFDFFPSVDAGQLRMHFRAPPGTTLEETERLVQSVEEQVRTLIPPDELRTMNDNLGLPLSFNLAFVPSDNIGGSDAEILVALHEHHRPSKEYRRAIRKMMAEKFPASTLYFQSADIVSQVLNFGLSAPIDLQIEGSDLTKTLPIATRLERELKEVPGLVDLHLAQVFGQPSLAVDVDRVRAAQVNLSERDVANSLLTSLSSSSLVSPSFWINPRNNVNYFVVVQTPATAVQSVADILSTPITTSSPGTGTLLPATSPLVGPAAMPFASPPLLGGIASVRPTTQRSVINHYTVQQVLDLHAAVEDRDLGSVAREIRQAVARLGELPKGVKITLRGQIETMTSSFQSLGVGLLLAIVLVYLLMVVLFQSWIDPFLIMIAVPGALAGILWALVITGTTLNVESFMGAIMAVGIAVSNSILLVHFANELRTENPDLSAPDAALEAGKIRLRPVLMTALAMMLGMLPMAIGAGEGGEQNAPLGRAVIGGLLFATVVTLLVVPAAYAVLRQRPPQLRRLDAVLSADE